MSSHRTRIIAEFKAKVALTALSESKTLSEISSESGFSFEFNRRVKIQPKVHPRIISESIAKYLGILNFRNFLFKGSHTSNPHCESSLCVQSHPRYSPASFGVC